jgi:hypothetical protein
MPLSSYNVIKRRSGRKSNSKMKSRMHPMYRKRKPQRTQKEILEKFGDWVKVESNNKSIGCVYWYNLKDGRTLWTNYSIEDNIETMRREFDQTHTHIELIALTIELSYIKKNRER